MSDAIKMLTLLRGNAKKSGSNRGLQGLAAQMGIQEIESIQRENENLKLQAESWAQEARTANGTIAEIYQIVTDSTGEPGNWHGAEPVRKRIAELRAAAITPEMRERIFALLNLIQPWHITEEVRKELKEVRDLLGEQDA